MPAVARTTDLPCARHVPRGAETRLNHPHLARDGAVGREQRIRQERRKRGRLRVHGLGHLLRVPAQAVLQRQAVRRLPLVLGEERELVVAHDRRARGIGGQPGAPGALEIEQERTARRGRPGRARRRQRHVGAVRAADRAGTEAARRGRRRVAEEAGDAVEEVAAGEEAAEHLIVQRVHPLAAELHRVRAFHDRHVVLDLAAPDQLVHARLQEERVAEAEGRPKAHAGVGEQVRRVGGARAGLARVGEVGFVEGVARQGGEEVGVEQVDPGRVALGAVGRRAVGGHVEGLVLLPRMVEVVRDRQAVGGGHVHVGLQQEGDGLDRMLQRLRLVLSQPALEEIEQRHPLTVG